MKIKIAIIVLAVASLSLLVALFATKKQTDDQHTNVLDAISYFSNQVLSAQSKINDLSQVNLALTNDLAASRAQLAAASQQLALSQQQLVQFSNSIAAITATLNATTDSLRGANGQIASLTGKVADLEAQNLALNVQANELTNALVQLNNQIEVTRSQLARSETDRQFLQTQLQKQLAQKAEIEHCFNDLDELRLQVSKIKKEMATAQRAKLNKNNNMFKKGAEILTQRPVKPKVPAPVTNSAAQPKKYDLNVEVGTDGSIKAIPAPATNSAQ